MTADAYRSDLPVTFVHARVQTAGPAHLHALRDHIGKRAIREWIQRGQQASQRAIGAAGGRILDDTCLYREHTRTHIDAVIAMVEDERYCPDVMRQVSALQGSLEGVNRVMLENHVETCVLHAVEEGRTGQIVEELLETLRYTPAVTGPSQEMDT